MSNGLAPELVNYFEARQQQRKSHAAKMWSLLKPRDQRLVREAAVMGFVQGTRAGSQRYDDGEPFPKDMEIVERVLIAMEGFPDLYPTFRRLSRRAARP